MRPRPDAAENSMTGPERARRIAGFNEAAARCRGKHADCRAGVLRDGDASMRPRPDAAENAAGRRRAAGNLSASMRPRPDAAENRARWPDRRRRAASCFNEAAARCRGKRRVGRASPAAAVASMRPRPDAAENSPPTRPRRRTRCGFNEAAARCRGKPAQPSTKTSRPTWLQ